MMGCDTGNDTGRKPSPKESADPGLDEWKEGLCQWGVVRMSMDRCGKASLHRPGKLHEFLLIAAPDDDGGRAEGFRPQVAVLHECATLDLENSAQGGS